MTVFHPTGLYWIRRKGDPEWTIAALMDGTAKIIGTPEAVSIDQCRVGQRVDYPSRAKQHTKWSGVAVGSDRLTFLARPDIRDSDRPICLLISGLGRDIDHIYPIFQLLEFVVDPIVMMLPGVFSDEIADPHVENIATLLHAALDSIAPGRARAVVGESIGGLIALASSSKFGRTIALDPPITMKDQWPIWLTLKKHGIGSPFLPRGLIAANIGMDPSEATRKDYTYLIKRQPNVVLVCGTDELMPPRPVPRTPSLVTSQDRTTAREYGARVVQLPSGHDIIGEAFCELRELLLREMKAFAHRS